MRLLDPCRRYRKIEGRGDAASERERAWLAEHRRQCARCAELDALTHLSLNFLRDAAVEPDLDDTFNARMLIRLRQDRQRRTVAFWTPAIVGAGVAAAALLALLQILFTVPEAKPVQLRGEEARMSTPAIPDYTDQSRRTQ